MSFLQGFEKTALWKELGTAALMASPHAHAQQPSKDLLNLIDRKAIAAGIDPKVMEGLVQTESSFTPTKINKEKTKNPLRYSVGLAQVQPRTARELGFKGSFKDLMKPEINLDYSTKYLAHKLKHYKGDYTKALSAYNAGHFIPANSQYVKKILTYRR